MWISQGRDRCMPLIWWKARFEVAHNSCIRYLLLRMMAKGTGWEEKREQTTMSSRKIRGFTKVTHEGSIVIININDQCL